MLKPLIVFIVSFACVCANAQDGSVFYDLLTRAVDSFNSQDCIGYSSCFVESSRKKKRRESGIYFASNDKTMRLKESHVLFEDDSNAEIAVAYSLGDSDYVSRVFFEREGDEWKISKEVLVRNESPYNEPSVSYASSNNSRQQQQTRYTSNPFADLQASSPASGFGSAPSNCSNGVCGGPKAPFSTLKACRDYGFEPIPCRNGNCSIK